MTNEPTQHLASLPVCASDLGAILASSNVQPPARLVKQRRKVGVVYEIDSKARATSISSTCRPY